MFFSRDVIYMLAGGFILDLILGDPEFLPHPVKVIGALVSFLEKRLNTGRKAFSLIFKGFVLVVLVLLSTAFAACFFLFLSFKLSGVLFIAVGAVMCWQCLAVKCLKISSMKVFYAMDGMLTDVKTDDLKPARQALSMIVGRDTEKLDKAGIIRAAVESVAESTCDGVMAPLFYLVLFGPLGGFIYKAANTMDSMIGYRNERYEYFGKAAARLDDVLNFIPSRITAIFMIIAAFFYRGFSGRDAFRVWLRDRNKLKSPNAGQTEAAAAGTLKIKLSGPAYYGGLLFDKPFIGKEFEREPEAEDIKKINNLMYFTAILGIIAVFCIFLITM